MASKNRMSISLSNEDMERLDLLANRFAMSKAQVIRHIIDDFLNSDSQRFNLLKNGSGGPFRNKR